MTTPPQRTSLDVLSSAAECLRALAHPPRLRMLQLLISGDHTDTELADAHDLLTAVASEHLGRMQLRGFVSSEKDGRKVYYHAVEPHPQHFLECIGERFLKRCLLPNFPGTAC